MPGLGIELKRLTPEMRTYLDEDVQGYVVTEVDRTSSAYLNGIRERQVISRINEQPLEPGNVKSNLNQLENNDRPVLLEVETERGPIMIGVRPERD